MPFREIYSVRFANNNLHPHINPFGWMAMQIAPSTPYDEADQFHDSYGIHLRIKRHLNVPGGAMAINSIYLLPPGGLRLNTRLRLRVVFDMPSATAFASHHDDKADEIEHQPGTWAIVLSYSALKEITDPKLRASVSCQFNPNFNGIRLNTPSELQSDQATNLLEPLNYSEIRGESGFQNVSDNLFDLLSHIRRPWKVRPEPAQFILEHTFSGWRMQELHHAAGCGHLYIQRSGHPSYLEDHRVYSATHFYDADPVSSNIGAPSIKALGISIACISGHGIMSARIKSFQLWYNASRAAPENPTNTDPPGFGME